MKNRTKEIIQYASAIGMLLLGSSLSIAGFLKSDGYIHDSILWLFAQCLLYAGSIFGVAIYMSDRFKRLELRLFEDKKEESKTKEDNNATTNK